ncbi:hypothetical protein ANN_23402 [Periplaneta americana]|uniref:Uncharacterized protein n=1 Tax=Periplaneta americana TaxID=6978 RepID=A0ABQ8SL07_PERAM|nr:hypothetical protein ANN_23402 [Periplaneta americana]
MSREEYKASSSTLCNYLHSPVTSSLLVPNIFLSTLFPNILNLCSSLKMRVQVSETYRTPNSGIRTKKDSSELLRVGCGGQKHGFYDKLSKNDYKHLKCGYGEEWEIKYEISMQEGKSNTLVRQHTASDILSQTGRFCLGPFDVTVITRIVMRLQHTASDILSQTGRFCLGPFDVTVITRIERIPNLTGEQSDGITVFRIPPMTSLMLHRCRTGAINLQRWWQSPSAAISESDWFLYRAGISRRMTSCTVVSWRCVLLWFCCIVCNEHNKDGEGQTDRQIGRQTGRWVDQIVSDEKRPDQTRPDQTRPDQTRPDQTRPDQNRTDQARTDQTKPHRIG